MIELKSLTRTYGEFTAVDNVSFNAAPGRVTGFLGPNGAGKSTTLRMLVGLTRPDRGQALIDGHLYTDIPNPGRHVGVLLDASAQHAGRTGREVLTLSAKVMGIDESRVDEMLKLVGLNQTEAKRRIKNYSLGMRQRLGIANALIGDPKVLILDEPANGLDPAGIHWMRQLLTHYASQGGTVLLSSHLLREIEVIADDLVVIGRGKIVAQGTTEELLASQGTLVAAEDPPALAAALQAAGIESVPDQQGRLVADADSLAVGRAAAAAGVVLTELRKPDSAGLEDLFLQLTADDAREAVTE